MTVAMAVLSGRADVGLGIQAAGAALDLEFIRITRERYTRSSLRRFWMIHACVSYSISFAHPASSSRSEPWTAMKKRKRGGLWVTPRLEWSSEPIASLPPQGIAHTMSRHVRSLPAPVILTI